MVKLDVRNYDAISAEVDKEPVQMFIGKSRTDKKYHLLGSRPAEVSYAFTDFECTSGNLGIVKLPKGKTLIEELKEGDVIRVTDEIGKPGPMNGAIYKGIR